MRPLHRVLVSLVERQNFFVMAIPLLFMREVGVSGELLFSFGMEREECGS